MQKSIAQTSDMAPRRPAAAPRLDAVAAVPSGIAITPKSSGIWNEPSATIDWVWNVPSMKLSPCAKLISSMIP